MFETKKAKSSKFGNNEFNELNKTLEKNPTLGIPYGSPNFSADIYNPGAFYEHDYLNGWRRVR